MASLQVPLTYNLINMVSFVGSSTSVADIFIYTKPQIEHNYLPHANAFGNKFIIEANNVGAYMIPLRCNVSHATHVFYTYK